MRKALSILLSAALAVTVMSCQVLEDLGIGGKGRPDEPVATFELKTMQADAGKGNQFVIITAPSGWELTIVGKTEEELDWAWLTTFTDDATELATLEGSGNSSTNMLHWAANNGSAPRSCTLELKAEGATISRTFTQAGGEEVIVTPAYITSDPVGGWMEIPEVRERDEMYFINHMMTSGTKTTRNYSYYWDLNALVAHWVAYPMNGALIGSGSRTNEWGLDPKMPRSCQPVLIGGYKGGYDRGHQIPSNDRLAYAANVATFYGTNMTPQIGRGFNQSNWAALEGRVHSWSMASGVDTLYVVTGCVLDGSYSVAYDNEGKEVRVPSGYYKALLAYCGAKAGSQAAMKDLASTGYYTSIAFFYDHQSYGSGDEPSMHAISINELERMTGENFFPRLSDEYEEAVEGRCDFSWWNKLK